MYLRVISPGGGAVQMTVCRRCKDIDSAITADGDVYLAMVHACILSDNNACVLWEWMPGIKLGMLI